MNFSVIFDLDIKLTAYRDNCRPMPSAFVFPAKYIHIYPNNIQAMYYLLRDICAHVYIPLCYFTHNRMLWRATWLFVHRHLIFLHKTRGMVGKE